jgi:hypothetical protein
MTRRLNMKTMKLQLAYIILILTLLLLTACTGGSSVEPQASATYSSKLTVTEAGENGTATGGEIEFTISEDGAGIASLSYNLTSDSCIADGITIQGVGTSSRKMPPPEVKNGTFIWEDENVQVEGTFTSSTEASGTITITIQHNVQTSINSPATKKITCDYGTWTWDASME